MTRIKIQIPKYSSFFKDKYQFQVGDLNYGNHVGNDRVLLITHEIRMRWLKSIEQSELSFFDTSLIMNSSACVYKSQGHFGETIDIEVFIDDLNDFGFDLVFNMRKESESFAQVKCAMTFFNYENQKLHKHPPQAFDFLANLTN